MMQTYFDLESEVCKKIEKATGNFSNKSMASDDAKKQMVSARENKDFIENKTIVIFSFRVVAAPLLFWRAWIALV